MKYLFLITVLLSSFFSRADAWDNLTREEADAVLIYLHDNPYIFRYCDCCDKEGDNVFMVRMVKVTQARIVSCEWDAEKFSVEYDFDPLAFITYQDDGSGFTVEPPFEVEENVDLIFMNYTWAFHAESNQAHPFFDIVEYSTYGTDNEPCGTYFSYPSPKELEAVGKFKAYKQWYARNVR